MKQLIKTPRGTFNAIQLKNKEEADKLGFCYYFTNTDKKDIYIKHLDMCHCKFGFIDTTE